MDFCFTMWAAHRCASVLMGCETGRRMRVWQNAMAGLNRWLTHSAEGRTPRFRSDYGYCDCLQRDSRERGEDDLNDSWRECDTSVANVCGVGVLQRCVARHVVVVHPSIHPAISPFLSTLFAYVSVGILPFSMLTNETLTGWSDEMVQVEGKQNACTFRYCLIILAKSESLGSHKNGARCVSYPKQEFTAWGWCFYLDKINPIRYKYVSQCFKIQDGNLVPLSSKDVRKDISAPAAVFLFSFQFRSLWAPKRITTNNRTHAIYSHYPRYTWISLLLY